MPENKSKVLLVDDDPAMLRILTKWLGEAYEIRTAADGKQAMQLIQAECPGVLITDWEMPGMNGLQLLKWLRAQELPHYVYSILVTIRCGKADILSGFEAGADTFLKKPVDRDELLARLLSGKRVVELEEKLSELSRVDTLTGLMNRATFHSQLEMEWGRVSRLPIPLSCVLLDLDGFHTLNQNLGQQPGDRVLKQVAEIVRENSRVSDAICRFTNDQIILLLVEAQEENARIWADRIRERIAQTSFTLPNGNTTHITASFGVAERSGETLCGNHLVQLAEQALHAAKGKGRNCVVAASSLKPNQVTTGSTVGEVFEELTARDIMSTIVPELRRKDPVEKAVRFLLRFNVCEVPVVNEQHRLIGMISEQELMAATLHKGWQEQTIQELVRSEVQQFTEQTSALEIYGYFCRTQARSVVITHAGQPTGVVSRQSLLLRYSEARAGSPYASPLAENVGSPLSFSPQAV